MKGTRWRGAAAANDLGERLSTVCGPIPEETGMDESVLLTEEWTREVLEGGQMSPIIFAPEEDLARDLFPKFTSERSEERESGAIVAGGGGQVVALSSAAPKRQHIRTVCRVRPLDESAGPLSLSVVDDFNVETSNATTLRGGGGISSTRFPFARVLDARTTQERVFEETVEPMLAPLFDVDGGNGVVIAYGATNAGKTYTIMGTPEREGILPRAIAAVYRMLEHYTSRLGNHADGGCGGDGDTPPARSTLRMHLRVAEVYNNKAYDLLRDGGVRARAVTFKERCGRDEIEGLSDHAPSDLVEALGLVRQAKKRAETSSTALNARSSRSHTFWMIELQDSQDENDGCGEDGGGRENQRPRVDRVRRLWIVDMAGSERILRSRSNGQEASHINQDHSALFRCLLQTEANRKRVSYRDRTLTRLFKDMFVQMDIPTRRATGAGGSLLGGPPTVPTPPAPMFVMLVNVNPAASEFSETQKVLHNSLISMKARPNEKRTLLHAPRVAYGVNGHLMKRHKTDHSFSGQQDPMAPGFGISWKRLREGQEPGGPRRSPHGLLVEAEDKIAELEEQLREADSRAAEMEAEARKEVQGQLFPVIDKLEVQLEEERRRHTQSLEETGKKLRRQASTVAAQKRGAKELLHSACRVHERLQECEEEVTRLRAENDRLVEALARKGRSIGSPSREEPEGANGAAGSVSEKEGVLPENEGERLRIEEGLRQAHAIAAEHKESATLARNEVEKRDAEIARLVDLLEKVGKTRVMDANKGANGREHMALPAVDVSSSTKHPLSRLSSSVGSGDRDREGQEDGMTQNIFSSVPADPCDDHGESTLLANNGGRSKENSPGVAIAARERTASSPRGQSGSSQRQKLGLEQQAPLEDSAQSPTRPSVAAGSELMEESSRDSEKNEDDRNGVSTITHVHSAHVPSRTQGAATEAHGEGGAVEEPRAGCLAEPSEEPAGGAKVKSVRDCGSNGVGNGTRAHHRAACSPGRPSSQAREEQFVEKETVEDIRAKSPAGLHTEPASETGMEPQKRERRLRRKRAPLDSLQRVDGEVTSVEEKPRERVERERRARGRARNEERVTAKRARERALLPAPSPKRQATQEEAKMSKVVAGVLARRGGVRQRRR